MIFMVKNFVNKVLRKLSKLLDIPSADLNNQANPELNVEEVFTEIYSQNGFGGDESVSGLGSSISQTQIVIAELPKLFIEFNVETVLDIPCGDFHWMKNVDLSKVNYIGADIVTDLISKNTLKYEQDNIKFRKLNLIQDELPKVDLIFCRDCLVHLSFKDIFLSLNNICNSQSSYLLTTTFTDRDHNLDIFAGQWRTLNLELSPFLLPTPIKVINEGCTEVDMKYTDKSLALWRIKDIKKFLDANGD
jgi:hypothetical protein